MHPKLLALGCALLSFVSSAVAQTVDRADNFARALKARITLAETLAAGKERSAPALAKLKSEKSVAGVYSDRDADMGFASLDIAQRLLMLQKPELAADFFAEAERSFELAVKKTSDSDAKTKGQFLQQLAIVRIRYLGKDKQGDEDLTAAEKLLPDDEQVKRTRRLVSREKSELSRNVAPKN